jgi:hypothetical protein
MDIYDIISRSLLHRLDEGEQQQLDQWLAEDEGHLRLYQSFLAKKDLVEQYPSTRLLMKSRVGRNWLRYWTSLPSHTLYIYGAGI